MTRLFDRKVRVVVGPPGAPGVALEGFRTTFTVGRTTKSKPAGAKIEIYNLHPSDAATIESSQQRTSVQLFAGYGDAVPRIFVGEVRKGRARTTINGSDRITRIEARDGGTRYRSARVNRSFSGQVTTGRVLREVSRAFGLTDIDVPVDLEDVKITQGFVASGPARDVMDELARTVGFDWFFEDDKIVISGRDKGVRASAVLLNSSSGLVEDVEKTNKGVNGRSLLNPAIRAKRVVQIDTPTTQGFFLVQKAVHKGDSGFSREFYTEFEAKVIPAGAGAAGGG